MRRFIPMRGGHDRWAARLAWSHLWPAALLLLATVSLSSAQTRRLTVIQEKAPMFKEASISSPIVKYLEKGASLNLLAEQDSFYLVSYGGFEGWVIPYSVQGPLEDAAGAAESGVTPATGQASAPAVEKPGQYLMVRGPYANLREGPGMEYKTIGRAYKGQKLEKFIKRGNWYRVRLPNSSIGFIREDLLTELPGSGAVQLAFAPAEATVTLETRVARLEQELSELRSLVLDYIRKSGGQSLSQDIPPANLEALEKALQASPSSSLQTPGGVRTYATDPRIIGNRGTRVYHLPSSIFYDKIPEEFRVYFNSEEEARKAGYIKSIQ